MPVQDLESRVTNLERVFADFAQELRLAADSFVDLSTFFFEVWSSYITWLGDTAERVTI